MVLETLPEKVSQVKGRISAIDQDLLGLEAAIEKLEVRFSKVLMPPPTDQKETDESVTNYVELAGTLNSIFKVINNANLKIRSIIDRCEL